MRLLAVDDDPIFLELLVVMLQTVSHEDVTTANSGQEALALIEKAVLPFECFLFDIQMPGMTGIQLCRAVREKDDYHRTPIVMITSETAKGFIDGAFKAGATDYLTKPLDRLELKARMGMVARLHEERERSAAYASRAVFATTASPAPQPNIDFAEPFLVPGSDRAMDYLALENYLLTLGATGQFAYSAFAVHIENAALIFARADARTFVNMLGDVESTIFDILKTEHAMLAYAGSGDFVGLLGRQPAVDLKDMELAVNVGLMDFEHIYAAEGLPIPTVRVGSLVRGAMLNFTRPTKLLDQAIALARTPIGQKPHLIQRVS